MEKYSLKQKRLNKGSARQEADRFCFIFFWVFERLDSRQQQQGICLKIAIFWVKKEQNPELTEHVVVVVDNNRKQNT